MNEPGMTADAPGAGRPLAALAVAIVVFMEIGTLAKPLGTIGPTRVADWLDLLTPYAVAGAAAWVLLRVRAATSGRLPDAVAWWLFGVGAVAFAQGGGIHLAANSIDNAGPTGSAGDVAYLWDEHVGHWIWYLGLLLILTAVVRSVLGAGAAAIDRVRPVGVLLAGLVGAALFANFVEGQTPWLGLAAAATGVAVGLRGRGRGPGAGASYLLTTAGTTLVLLLAWGGYWLIADGRVFPQFSELGWI